MANNQKEQKLLEVSYEFACYFWRRKDLEAKPKNIERGAEVLRHAGIEVYEITTNDRLVCEPRPLGVREALTGELITGICAQYEGYTVEESGVVLKLLAAKGVTVAKRTGTQ
jgi:hypothetical protein